MLCDPIDLKVSDHETTETANQVQQGGYFPLPWSGISIFETSRMARSENLPDI